MINSKLVGKSLPEIIHMIVFEQVTSVNYHDGAHMESLLQEYISSSEDSYYEGMTNANTELEERIEELEQLLKEHGIEY